MLALSFSGFIHYKWGSQGSESMQQKETEEGKMGVQITFILTIQTPPIAAYVLQLFHTS